MPLIPAVTEALEVEVTRANLKGPTDAVASEARRGLMSTPKVLAPWLFYDDAGSLLFEEITELQEYYPTRTERELFLAHADEIIQRASISDDSTRPVLSIVELGAGTATKTGILLRAAVRSQGRVLYQPVDVSESALRAATENIRGSMPGVDIRCQIADYTSEPLKIDRRPHTRILALYIGSSIGNFSPAEARRILCNLRRQLAPGDRLLLGTDLAPNANKTVETIVAAYNDHTGITAAFNRNVLVRLNRELGTDFDPNAFRHEARWNSEESRIEMHLISTRRQQVHIPANSAGPAFTITLAPGESIHTENSYKFTLTAVRELLNAARFELTDMWQDPGMRFAINLATAI